MSGWKKLKIISGAAFAAFILIDNIYWFVRGIGTGAVMTLSRRASHMVYASAEPGWFAFNLSLRAFTIGFILLGSWIFLKRLLDGEIQ